MFRYLLQIVSVFTLVALISACAQMSPLTGGPRDTQAPRLIDASPKHLETYFHSKSVILKFDEFVQLKELNSQLVISPKLKNQPDIFADGKKIIIQIDTNELKKNTTYRFYFGEAICDMNEGNPAKNFEYIFSTGNFIDSLTISGQVKDAFNNRALDKAFIGIHTHNLKNDSLPYKEVPDYVTESDASGKFSIDHLPKGNYRIYAFTDANKNLIYDRDIEKIGFLEDTLALIKDSTISFSLFHEDPSLTYLKKVTAPYFGHVRALLNKKAKYKLEALPPYNKEDIYLKEDKALSDTLLIYYRNITDSIKLCIKYEGIAKKDSILLNLPKKNLRQKKFGFISLNTNAQVLALNVPLEINFITWMDTSKTNWEKFRLISHKDSIHDTLSLHGFWKDVTSLQITNQFKEGTHYSLIIDTAAFYDVNKLINDSAKFDFNAQSKNELGKVSLRMLFEQKENHIVQLITEKELVVKEQIVSLSLSSSNAKTIEFTDVPPGAYHVKVIFDANKNNKWDSGDLFSKKHPEKVFINSKLLKVIQDWETEEEILFKE